MKYEINSISKLVVKIPVTEFRIIIEIFMWKAIDHRSIRAADSHDMMLIASEFAIVVLVVLAASI